MVYILLGISFFFPPLWFVSIPYAAYLLITYEKRREKYAEEGLVWETGGAFRTGQVDLDRAFLLYRKSSRMGSAKGTFYLAQMYKYGNGVAQSDLLYDTYMRKSAMQDLELFHQLNGIVEGDSHSGYEGIDVNSGISRSRPPSHVKVSTEHEKGNTNTVWEKSSDNMKEITDLIKNHKTGGGK
jgi:hypothetical protein